MAFDPKARPDLHERFVASLARALAQEDARQAKHVAWLKSLDLRDPDRDRDWTLPVRRR
jgi:hypothetical protein